MNGPDALPETRAELLTMLGDWWRAIDADRAWLESEQQRLSREDDEDGEEDDRDPQSFK